MKLYGIDELPQRSPAWYAKRCGIPTSSCADKIITPKTGALSAQHEAYINVLLAERAGFEQEPIDGKWLAHGIEQEGEAVDFFELDSGLVVEAVGFITNDAGTAGCSPDGILRAGKELIGWEGKAPAPWTHIGYLRAGALPDQYRPQIHMSLAITGWNRWVFQSYCRGLDPLIVWVERDEYTEKVEAALAEFIDKLEAEAARFGLARDMREAA